MNRAKLTAQDRQTYRRKLQDLTARLSSGVVQLAAEARRTPPLPTESDLPAHEADRAVLASEEQVARTLLASEGQILTEATAALERLDAGTFGTCERCGAAIAKARLDAVPYTRSCVRCARADESPDTV